MYVRVTPTRSQNGPETDRNADWRRQTGRAARILHVLFDCLSLLLYWPGQRTEKKTIEKFIIIYLGPVAASSL